MKKTLIISIFFILILTVSAKSYQRDDEDECYKFKMKVVLENNIAKLIVVGITKDKNFKDFVKIFTGEIKGEEIHIHQMQYNGVLKKYVAVEVFKFKICEEILVIGNEVYSEVIKKCLWEIRR